MKNTKKSWAKKFSAEDKAEYRKKRKEDEKLDLSLIQSLLISRMERVIAMGPEYADKYVRAFPEADPKNISGRPYHGYNRRYLGMLGIDWTITPNQLRACNRKTFGKKKEDEAKYYKPREGAILYPIIKYGYSEFVATKIDEKTGEEKKEVASRYWYKGYYVYDIADIEGFPVPLGETTKRVHKNEVDIPLANAIARTWSTIVPIKYGYNGACFVGSKLNHGEIHVPNKDVCDSLAEFFCTLYHEITHSTGQFLGRDMSGKFGSTTYAREECVAEFGGVIFSELLGVRAKIFDNAIAYIRSWIRYLADDPKVLYHASKKSEEAVMLVVKKYNELKTEDEPALEYCPWKEEKEDEEEPKEEVKEEPKDVEFDPKTETYNLKLSKEKMEKLMSFIAQLN